MTIARASVIRGPAIITFASVTMYTESDIVLTPGLSTAPVNTSFFGSVDDIDLDAIVSVQFTPAGVWAYKTALLLNATRAIGSDIYGSDATCVIHALNGDKITLKAAALRQLPQLRFAVGQQLYGPATITGIRADNTAWSTAESLYKTETAAFSDTSFDPANIVMQTYSIVWGVAAPWSAVTTDVGATVDFSMQLTPVVTDDSGTIGETFGGISAVARFRPLNATGANVLDLLRLQYTGAARGARRSALKANLVISGTGVSFTLNNAHPISGGVNFGSTAIRPGEVAFGTSRSFTTGAMTALFTLA